jgi:hypothetical protein
MRENAALAIPAMLIALAACSRVPDLGQPCATGMIATAEGCVPEPSGPLPDAEPSHPRDASTALDGGSPPADAGQKDSSDAARDGARDDAGAAEPLDAATDGGVDLNGAWAWQTITTDTVSNTDLGTSDVEITMLYLVQIVEQSTQLAITVKVCAINPTAFQGYTTTYPSTAIGAYSPLEISGTIIGSAFKPAELVLLLGWQPLGDPALEPIPTERADPRLVDGDGDSNPGVTLNVSGPDSGDIYIASRAILDLSGNVLSPDRIEGMVQGNRAQGVLGASNQNLLLGTTRIAPNPNGTNTFEMVRLDQINHTCSAIINNRRTLFP